MPHYHSPRKQWPCHNNLTSYITSHYLISFRKYNTLTLQLNNIFGILKTDIIKTSVYSKEMWHLFNNLSLFVCVTTQTINKSMDLHESDHWLVAKVDWLAKCLAGRHTNTQKHRQADRHKQTDKTDRHKQTEIDRQKHTETQTETHPVKTHRYTRRETERDRQEHRQVQTHTHRQEDSLTA